VVVQTTALLLAYSAEQAMILLRPMPK
jgi:hypothetical protein